MKVDVYIQGQRLDLFDDENITVKSVAQDINDITKLYADYSQSFTVPASKNNNAIFSHYYNADIDNGFDARIRVPATIDVNTLDFKRGKIRLDEVKLEHGVPKHYRITFFGDVIKIKDEIGEDKLKDLTWLSNFNHDYTEAKVKEGLTDGLDFILAEDWFDAIVYPAISYKRQWLYNSDSNDVTSTDTLVNIAYDSGRSDGINYRYLKPAIKLEVLIKAIEEQYGFNFSGAFFDSDEFKGIYMNLNKETESLSSGIKLFEDVSGNITYPESSASEDNLKYRVKIIPNDPTVRYKIRLTFNGSEVAYTDWLYDTDSVMARIDVIPETYECKAEVITDEDLTFNAETSLKNYIEEDFFRVTEFSYTYTNEVIDLNVDINELMPDIKVYDFLTSLFKMFNLVVRPDGDDIYIEDLQSWYINGQIYNITPYVDTKDLTVKRGQIYKQIDFKFEESEQIIADEWRQSNGKGYGDFEFILEENLDGDKFDIEVIFEQPIFEHLTDQNTNSLSGSLYCPYFDKDRSEISGNAFLFYVNRVTGDTWGFVGNNDVYSSISSLIMPSHSEILTSDSFNLNFSKEANEYSYSYYENTIVNKYYLDYLTDMLSSKRRLYSLNAILPNNLLNTLKLNDRLIIKDRRYIINSINTNLTTGLSNLELINDIYDAPLVSDILNTSVFSPASKTYDYNTRSGATAYYIGLSGKSIAAVDLGDGVSWIKLNDSTTTSNTMSISFDITSENESNVTRAVGIQVTDGINNPTFTIIQTYQFTPSYNFSDDRNSQYLPLL